MEKEKEIEEVSRLIIRAVRGSAGPQDQERLKKWLSAAPENRSLYRRLLAGEGFAPDYLRYRQAGRTDGWPDIAARIRIRKKRILRRRLSFAAAILIAAGLSLLPLIPRPGSGPLAGTADADIRPGSTKAVLLLAGGERICLDSCPSMDSSLLFRHGISRNRDMLAFSEDPLSDREDVHRLMVPRGGEYFLRLKDGSRIWVNSESVLEIPAGSDGRWVELVQGEAYFKIAPDSLRPFRVLTSRLTIEVTGTEFNVSNYLDDKEIKTTLARGSVRLCTGGQTLSLERGEQGILPKEGHGLQKHRVDVGFYTSWKDGLFEFKDMRLQEVCRQLTRWYDVDFVFSRKSLEDVRFTGAVKRSSSLAFILQLIRETRTVGYRMEGRKVIFSSKP